MRPVILLLAKAAVAHGPGMAICKTSCLGPYSLAPVAQVWPEGSIYAGLDEEVIDHILDQHIQMGKVVEDLSFERNGRKQQLNEAELG